MNYQICANQNWAVAFSGARRRTWGSWFGPGHDFEIKNVYVVEEVFTIPASKNDHLGSTYKISWVIKSRGWRTTSLWTLIPSHSYWVKSVQISEYILRSFTSENDYSWSSQYRRVSVPLWRRCSWNFRFDPSGRIYVQNICVIHILEALFLTFVVMASKNDKRSSGECSRMTSPGSGWHSLNLWKSPKPLTLNWNKKDETENTTYLLLPPARHPLPEIATFGSDFVIIVGPSLIDSKVRRSVGPTYVPLRLLH